MANPVLVIMAAGMGSRYGGLKQIDPIGPNGQILLDYSIYDAHRAGFDRVVFIIRPELHEAFEDAIGKKARRFMQVDYAYQTLDNLPDGLTAPEGREKPLGTAHAVWCAKELTAGCPIAVINADDFYGADAFRKMYDYLSAAQDDDKFRYCMVGYQVENTLTENGTVSRGVCTADENGLLAHIIERTAIHRDADGIIRYVRAMQNSMGSNVETLYKIVQNKAEALEFRVGKDAPLIGIPLEKLSFKDNLLIACINRGGQIITPRGKDTIEPGDTVIVVTTHSGLKDLKDILR